jgi:hypothetical protein
MIIRLSGQRGHTTTARSRTDDPKDRNKDDEFRCASARQSDGAASTRSVRLRGSPRLTETAFAVGVAMRAAYRPAFEITN